jgi:hypothetical protein
MTLLIYNKKLNKVLCNGLWIDYGFGNVEYRTEIEAIDAVKNYAFSSKSNFVDCLYNVVTLSTYNFLNKKYSSGFQVINKNDPFQNFKLAIDYIFPYNMIDTNLFSNIHEHDYLSELLSIEGINPNELDYFVVIDPNFFINFRYNHLKSLMITKSNSPIKKTVYGHSFIKNIIHLSTDVYETAFPMLFNPTHPQLIYNNFIFYKTKEEAIISSFKMNTITSTHVFSFQQLLAEATKLISISD